jgi:hypothetical protein
MSGVTVALFEQSFRCCGAQIAGGLTVRYNPPLVNPCSSNDPLVGGLNDLFQVLVRDSPLRQVVANSCYFGAQAQ